MTGFRYDQPTTSPGFLLWRVTNAWQRRVRAALAPSELTHVQFVLLAALAWFDASAEPPTQRTLANFAGSDEMMTSQVVRTLERKGLVERCRHGVDGRAWVVSLTTTGRELVGPAVAAVEAADEEFFGRLDTAERGFLAGLRTLAAE